MLAPIVVLVYNRPNHARMLLQSIAANALASETDIFIFSDGPKDCDIENVASVRKIIREQQWGNRVFIEEMEENKGLAWSVVNGTTSIINKYGFAIILEDDLIVSKCFLEYMNTALDLYKDDGLVMHVSGYMFPIKRNLPETFFLRQTSCWGWGTWKRAWERFNPDAKHLLNKIVANKLERQFNIEGTYNYSNGLRANAENKIKTWAVKWYASVFLENGLCLHPNRSLTSNRGFDGTGSNCSKDDYYGNTVFPSAINVKRIPLRESQKAKNALRIFHRKNRPSLLSTIITGLIAFNKHK